MLKIKDNVDLKELEKFGFEYEEPVYQKKISKTGKEFIYCDIYAESSREIDIYIGDDIDDNPRDDCPINVDVLYDLIKADLVEKVQK